MNKLKIELSDKIIGHFETECKRGFLTLNKSFIVDKITINGEIVTTKIIEENNYQLISFSPKNGNLVVDYHGFLDGNTGMFPYVKEKTTERFYILRNETVYYPLVVVPFSKEFMDMVMYPTLDDQYCLDITINDNRRFISNLKEEKGFFTGYNPTIVVGDYVTNKYWFGSINYLDLSAKEINPVIELIKVTNEYLYQFKPAKIKDLNIIVIPNGYGSFVLSNTMFVVKDGLEDRKQLIHELIHTNWNPLCDTQTQAARFFDEAFTQYLTLRALDALNIQDRLITKKNYIEDYKQMINEYEYTPYPILEYSKNNCGDLAYSFGALAILAIEEKIGIKEMDRIIRRILTDMRTVVFDFDTFKNQFQDIDDVWEDYFVTNKASSNILHNS